MITGVEDLESASLTEASFLANPRYRSLLATTNAGVICIDPSTPRIDEKNYLLSSSPTATFQKLIELFGKDKLPFTGFTGIHPTAVIHPSATIAPDAAIGPHAVIDAGCTIGAKTIIGPHVVLCAGASIGIACHLHPHCTVREGCILGTASYSSPAPSSAPAASATPPTPTANTKNKSRSGIVILEDDVEIGANTTIDRARFKETRISRGTKIDNLVQIGHNVTIGPHNLIVSQTGISGSVKTGKYVIVGGQTGIVGHLEIADGAMFAARSGIKKSIKTAGKFGGIPLSRWPNTNATKSTSKTSANLLPSSASSKPS